MPVEIQQRSLGGQVPQHDSVVPTSTKQVLLVLAERNARDLLRHSERPARHLVAIASGHACTTAWIRTILS